MATATRTNGTGDARRAPGRDPRRGGRRRGRHSPTSATELNERGGRADDRRTSTDLDELHLEYEEKAEAMSAAETAWLARLGSTKEHGPRPTQGFPCSGPEGRDAITDLLDAKALVSPAGAVLVPDVLDLIV